MKISLLLVFLCFIACKQTDKATHSSSWANKLTLNEAPNVKIAAGKLVRIDSFPSAFIRGRAVDIWLPEGFNPNEKLSVLYMHDGQMLFDSTTTWNKQEWKVDEVASALMEAGKTKRFMVVAPHNIPEFRWHDYFPQKSMSYMNKSVKDSIFQAAALQGTDTVLNADNYLNFLVKELKVFIDAHYPTYTDRSHTFIAGSSMGGLISMYAVSEYPEVFGGAACLSTHWPGAMPTENNPYPEAIFKYMENHLPRAGAHKLYFDYGDQTLDAHYPQYAPRIDNILHQKGYGLTDAQNFYFKGTEHSETAWQERLHIPLEFLFKTDTP